MLLYFIHYISTTNPDIWTGWNTETFDIPYMVNRISRVLDSDHVKKLSPFGYIREKNVIIQGREIQTFELYGVVSLDYLELYQTLPQPRQGPFDMGYVAQQEKLTAQKLDLPGESFKDNYDNYFQTFVQYSAVDSIVIKELDEKLKLIDIVFSLATLQTHSVPCCRGKSSFSTTLQNAR
jgi:DNA polymerase elongation subunit (family B)